MKLTRASKDSVEVEGHGVFHQGDTIEVQDHVAKQLLGQGWKADTGSTKKAPPATAGEEGD